MLYDITLLRNIMWDTILFGISNLVSYLMLVAILELLILNKTTSS